MTRAFFFLKLLVLSTLGFGALHAAESGPVTLEAHITPLLKQYCFECHNPKKQKGDVNLEEVAKNPQLQENRDVWAKVVESMEKGDMPPEKKPQPSGEQRDLVLHFLDGQLSKLDCLKERNPGRVTIRRLNREEYRNTIRDLLKVDFYPVDFPNDEVGYGFDNIGDVLSLSPMLMEKYLAAAETVAQKAILTGAAAAPVRKTPGREFQATGTGNGAQEDALALMTEGEGTRSLEFPEAGEYTLRVRAYGDQAGPDAPRLRLSVDGQELETFAVKAVAHHAQNYEAKVTLEKGWRKIGVAFLNNYKDETNSDPKLRGDRNLYVEWVEVQFPPGVEALPASHRQIIPKTPAAGEELTTAREQLRLLLARAYRRPVTEPEVERLVKFVDLALHNKGSYAEGMQLAVQAILCSPQFLFRWELDPGTAQPGGVRELNDYEVASRLSYFLWSSLPDEQLTALAAKGELRKDGNLERQIRRMLGDWKARALVNGFADQWLQIRNIYEVSPDPNLFPRFSDDLKGMMKEETERFFEAVMKEDRNVYDLIEANFTFVNEKLAKFYGLPGVRGAEFRRVELPPDSPRGGVLTQGAVLLATSTPTRTSPVIRGKWIMEQILGTPPPAPPADVPPLNEQSSVNQTASLRERMSAHSQREECAGCHKRMDPLGFALENFDATGGWREQDGKFPIDASGKLPNGVAFNGPRELKSGLKRSDAFVKTLAEKMMTYALGRGLAFADECAVKKVVEDSRAQRNHFSALVTAIVTSDPFLKRQTAEALTSN